MDTDTGPVKAGDQVGVSHMFETNGGQPWSYVGALHDTVAVIANDLARGRLRDLDGDILLHIEMTTLATFSRSARRTT